jgi:hypothetical protein
VTTSTSSPSATPTPPATTGATASTNTSPTTATVEPAIGNDLIEQIVVPDPGR